MRVRVGLVAIGAASLAASGAAVSASAVVGPAVSPGFTVPITLQAATSAEAWQNQVTTTPSGVSVVVWSDGERLLARQRDPSTSLWSAQQIVSTDIVSNVHLIGTAPVEASSPSGEVAVAWVSSLGGPIEVSTLAPGSQDWSTPKAVSAAGSASASPEIAFGTDGTLAVTWDDGSDISAAVRTPAGTWSATQSLTPAVDTDVTPAFATPSIAVASDGEVVATWYADDGLDSDGNRVFRLQGSDRPTGGAWTSPEWISAPDRSANSDSPATLSAGTNGTVAVSWTDPVNGYLAVFDGQSWSDPTPLVQVNGPTVALAAGPAGTYTGVWTHTDQSTGTDQVLSAGYVPASGWAAPLVVASGGPFEEPAVTMSDDGTATATWIEWASVHVVAQAVLPAGAATWGQPLQVTSSDGTDEYHVSADKAGYQTVTMNLADPNTSTSHAYALTSEAMAWPRLVPTKGPQLTGTPSVGKTLTVTPGTWSPADAVVSVQWRRGAVPIPGVGDTFTYTIGENDAGWPIEPLITITAPFYRPWIIGLSSHPIAKLSSTISTSGSTRVTYGQVAHVDARLSDPYRVLKSTQLYPLDLVLYTRAGPKGAWKASANVYPTNGTVTAVFTPRTLTQYQWRFAGTFNLNASTGAVHTVSVVPLVHAHILHGSRGLGTRDTIWGTESPATSGNTLLVQRYDKSGWHTVAHIHSRTQVLPDMTRRVGFTYSFTQRHHGTYLYRVQQVATAGLAAAISNHERVTYK